MSRSEGAQVGSTGDFALYSFRKQLPVASGAALVWNRPHSGLQLRPPEGRSTPGILPALREAASWTVFASGSRRLREWLAPALSDERGLHAAPPGRAPAMDVVTRMVVGRLSARLDEIAVRRRANYRTVESMLGGLPEFTPFFSALPPGAVPWGFPLRVGASAQDRDGALSVLLREGIGAWAWPELPDEVTEARFPDEYRWAREALVLPVHQGLRGQQAQQVADTLAGWAVGHSGEA
jgi:dTDP-4-amino-4,6-dideoxygalactose transaminase